MAYIKNQILQNNALEAWAMAVRYCDYILEGKVTLEYRKHFVSVLHNAVELFVKQLMLNNTDYRVTQLKKGCNPDGQPARDFYNSKDLNAYFNSLDEQTMKKFFSIEFNKIVDITNQLFSEYYDQNGDTSVKSALSLLSIPKFLSNRYYAGDSVHGQHTNDSFREKHQQREPEEKGKQRKCIWPNREK